MFLDKVRTPVKFLEVIRSPDPESVSGSRPYSPWQTYARSLSALVDDCIVDESSRVCLQPIRGVDGSDYINANFIHVSRLSRDFVSLQFRFALFHLHAASNITNYTL